MAIAGLKRSQDVEDLFPYLSQFDEEGNVKALESALRPGLGAEGMVGSQ